MNETGQNLIEKILLLTIFSVYWKDLLKIDKMNADNSTKMYLVKIDMLVHTYAPLKLIIK